MNHQHYTIVKQTEHDMVGNMIFDRAGRPVASALLITDAIAFTTGKIGIDELQVRNSDILRVRLAREALMKAVKLLDALQGFDKHEVLQHLSDATTHMENHR